MDLCVMCVMCVMCQVCVKCVSSVSCVKCFMCHVCLVSPFACQRLPPQGGPGLGAMRTLDLMKSDCSAFSTSDELVPKGVFATWSARRVSAWARN
jgi:hypothetical protein